MIKQFTGNWQQKHRGQQEAGAAGRLGRMQRGASEDLSGGSQRHHHTGHTTGRVTLWASVSTLNTLGEPSLIYLTRDFLESPTYNPRWEHFCETYKQKLELSRGWKQSPPGVINILAKGLSKSVNTNEWEK